MYLLIWPHSSSPAKASVLLSSASIEHHVFTNPKVLSLTLTFFWTLSFDHVFWWKENMLLISFPYFLLCSCWSSFYLYSCRLFLGDIISHYLLPREWGFQSWRYRDNFIWRIRMWKVKSWVRKLLLKFLITWTFHLLLSQSKAESGMDWLGASF